MVLESVIIHCCLKQDFYIFNFSLGLLRAFNGNWKYCVVCYAFSTTCRTRGDVSRDTKLSHDGRRQQQPATVHFSAWFDSKSFIRSTYFQTNVRSTRGNAVISSALSAEMKRRVSLKEHVQLVPGCTQKQIEQNRQTPFQDYGQLLRLLRTSGINDH